MSYDNVPMCQFGCDFNTMTHVHVNLLCDSLLTQLIYPKSAFTYKVSQTQLTPCPLVGAKHL